MHACMHACIHTYLCICSVNPPQANLVSDVPPHVETTLIYDFSAWSLEHNIYSKKLYASG